MMNCTKLVLKALLVLLIALIGVGLVTTSEAHAAPAFGFTPTPEPTATPTPEPTASPTPVPTQQPPPQPTPEPPPILPETGDATPLSSSILFLASVAFTLAGITVIWLSGVNRREEKCGVPVETE